MAVLVVEQRHLWLTLSDMKENDRVFLMDAPITPFGLFGDAVNSIIDRYQEARKQRFLPHHSLALGAAGWEQPPPCTSSSYWEAQKQSVASRADDALGRGLQSLNRICGPSFRLRSPRPRSPDAHGSGLLRAGPSGKEWCTQHHTVPVSPQCPREISLPTLPLTVLQGTALSSERFS